MSQPYSEAASKAASGAASAGTGKIRLDKWLWYARVFKSRSLAQSEIKSGKVRVDNVKVTSPSRTVEPGNVLTVTKARAVLIHKIVHCGVRRGPAPEAQTLYEDLTPPPPPKDSATILSRAPHREPGAGRPTKKQRREINRFKARSGDQL